MKVHIHTLVVRIVSEDPDTQRFAEALREGLGEGFGAMEENVLTSVVDPLFKGTATVPNMPQGQAASWCRDHIDPLIGAE